MLVEIKTYTESENTILLNNFHVDKYIIVSKGNPTLFRRAETKIQLLMKDCPCWKTDWMYILTTMVMCIVSAARPPSPRKHHHPHAASFSPTQNHHNRNYLAGNKTVYVPGFASTLVLVSDFLFYVAFYIFHWFPLIPTLKLLSV